MHDVQAVHDARVEEDHVEPTKATKLLTALDQLDRLREKSNRYHAKRRHRRFNVRSEVLLYPMDMRQTDRDPVPAVVRDLSRTGMGFVSQTPLPIGAAYRASFLNRSFVIGQQALIIRHAREVEDGAYLIGSEFCIESGLMCLLGVKPSEIEDGDVAWNEDSGPRAFVAPNEIVA